MTIDTNTQLSLVQLFKGMEAKDADLLAMLKTQDATIKAQADALAAQRTSIDDLKAQLNAHVTDQAGVLAGQTFALGYGDGFGAATFGTAPAAKILLGRVYLSGVAQRTTGNVAQSDRPFAALPATTRPSAKRYPAPLQGSGNSTVTVEVWTDGQIVVKSAPTGTTGWLSLDGVNFDL